MHVSTCESNITFTKNSPNENNETAPTKHKKHSFYEEKK